VRDALRDPRTFANQVHHHLYGVQREHFKTSLGSNFPRALGELLVRRALDGLKTVVITTNFDDSIEYVFKHDPLIRSINNHSLNVRPRYRRSLPKGKNTLCVHHIHGFIPREGSISLKQELILSEADFNRPWSEHWSHDLLMEHATNQWLFIGMSFQDPHISFYLTQRQNAAPSAPSPIGIFSLQGRPWRALRGSPVLEALVEAELARLRELGMNDVLITLYYFQDAQLLREAARPANGDAKGYCDRRREWFTRLEETYLNRPQEERFVRSLEFNKILRDVRSLMERNLRQVDPKNRETIKVELYARDTKQRALFLIASSESVLLDPARSRRFPLGFDDDKVAAAVRAFTRGMPGLDPKKGPHIHGRWNGFWSTPIMLGAPPWYGLPVGALVVCTTHDLDSTSLRLTIPNVETELHIAIQECARLLDPAERVEDEDLTTVLRPKVEKMETTEQRSHS
jgi:hypothetical protein